MNRSPEGPFESARSTTRGGRPRSLRTEEAILDAARALLTETSLSRLTMEQVAARAGVGKASIYRRWPSKETLALALLLQMAEAMLPVPETGDTRADLVAMVRAVTDTFTTSPMGRVVQGLLSDLALNPALAEPFRAAVVRARREQLDRVLARGIERGEIRPDADVGLAAELLIGPIYYRLIFAGDFPADFAERVVDTLLAGYRAAEPRRTRLR